MLRHPYARALAAFIGSWMCLGGSAGLAVAGAAGVRTAPGIALFAFIAGGILSLLGIFLLVNAVTCAAYGTVRSLQRGEAGRPAGARAAAEQPMPYARSAAAIVPELAPIPFDDPGTPMPTATPAPAPTPKPICLVMKDPTGKIARLPLRDPSKRDQYIAKYEDRGYKFLRTEDYQG